MAQDGGEVLVLKRNTNKNHHNDDENDDVTITN